MMELSPLQTECLNALISAREFIAFPKKFSRKQYEELMGHLRDAIMHLENVQYGCVTGQHAGQCDCDKGVKSANANLLPNNTTTKR